MTGLRQFFHWLALAFALPLLIVIGSGLVLALEPIVQQAAMRPGSPTVEILDSLLARHDPAGDAWFISVKLYDDRLLIGAPSPRCPIIIDLATGEPSRAAVALSDVFLAARQLHDNLMLSLRPVVLASSYVMLILIALRFAIGLPRVTGWRKAFSYLCLPLLVASPLTGLLIAHGITFSPLPQPSVAPPMPLREAVQRVQASGHDISSLVWLKSQRGQVRTRLIENGEWRIYTVSAEGVAPMSPSWPNALHSGQIAGYWFPAASIAAGVGLLALIGTGVLAWPWKGPTVSRPRTGPRSLASAQPK